METIVNVLITSHFIFHCNGVSLREQLEHIANRQKENRGIHGVWRRFDVDPSHASVILGAPSMASHLPEAEPILPGHTLLRPARGMLKSSVKFPHRDLDGGAGVYGNINNLGIRYDGKQDRVMYTGFRRMPSKNYIVRPNTDIIEFEESQMEFPSNKIKETSAYVPIVVLKTNNIMDYLLHLYVLRPNKNKFVKDKIGYRKHKYDTNKVLKLLKELKHINKDSLIKANIMRRKVKPFGFILMDKPDEGAKYIKDASYEEDPREESDIIDEKPEEISNEKIDKKKWFWNTKDAYNHIKINPDAPEQADFMPTNLEDKTTNWSYYNQIENNEKEDTIT